MEMHDYAAKMQDDLIHDIESGRPDYVVFINDDLSWRVRENSERKIYQWWDAYWGRHYDVEQTINITELNDAGQMVNGGKYLLVLKRKRGDGVANPKSE